MRANIILRAGKSADHTLYHAEPKASRMPAACLSRLLTWIAYFYSGPHDPHALTRTGFLEEVP